MKGLLRNPVAAGVLAGGGLLVFYLTIVTIGQGSDAAVAQLRNDAPLLVPIFPLFGAQIGLFVYLKARVAGSTRGIGAATGIGGGVSGTAVLACCAHLIPTFLPVVGISAFATALAALRGPLLVAAILSNLAGLSLIVRALVRMRGRAESAESAGREAGL